MANGKQIEAALKISGELDASLKQAIKAAEDRMAQLSDAAEKAEGATAGLNNMIKKQGQTLKAAQAQYASFVLNGDEASAEAQQLAAGIAELTADLNRNKAALVAAENAAKELADGLDQADGAGSRAGKGIQEAGDGARNAGDGFTIAKGAIANLVSSGFQALISGAGQAVQALLRLSEQTQEFRQDMASLETAYGQANFSAKQAQNTWLDLYAVLGEEDRAVETANGIALMADNQKELSDWVTITTGVWGTYQDMLPVESLAEAAAETAKTGTVTGTMADALNWSTEAAEMFSKHMGGDVVTAEDAFNEALKTCNTEAERQAFINETLTKLYADAADQYEKTSGSLMDARRATGELLTTQAELGETLEPVTTAWTVLKTELMQAVAPALEWVADKAMAVMGWLEKHPTVLEAVSIALGVLGAAIGAITIALGVYAVAQMLANTAMLPVIGIALLIAAGLAVVIGVGYLLAQNWDRIKQKAGEVWEYIKTAWEGIKQAINNAVQAVVTFVTQKWTALIATITDIWNKVMNAVEKIWNSIKKKASSFASGAVNAIKNKWNSLTSILTAPFRSVMGVIDTVSSKIGSLASKASRVGSSIMSALPGFASGGFTQGISIAGEAGTEAVISFDPRYRADNLRYWAQAGRMLGADHSDFGLSRSSGGGGGATVIENVTFAPNITVQGDAKKQDIIEAIRETYSEFVDLIDEVLEDREVGAYA